MTCDISDGFVFRSAITFFFDWALNTQESVNLETSQRAEKRIKKKKKAEKKLCKAFVFPSAMSSASRWLVVKYTS